MSAPDPRSPVSRDALQLLAKDQLLITGERDKARWNYVFGLSVLQRARFRLITRLIDHLRCEDILEIGYGSGIFLPELHRRSRQLYGVDIHPHARAVQERLAAAGLHVTLHTGSAENIPLASKSVDLVVAISTLEYVADQHRAARELHRVLRPNGRLAIVYPLPHALSDIGLRAATGESADQYGDGRRTLLPALCAQFTVERRLAYPAWLPGPLRVYEAALLVPCVANIDAAASP